MGRKHAAQSASVIPAKAGIQRDPGILDPDFRRGDALQMSAACAISHPAASSV